MIKQILHLIKMGYKVSFRSAPAGQFTILLQKNPPKMGEDDRIIRHEQWLPEDHMTEEKVVECLKFMEDKASKS